MLHPDTINFLKTLSENNNRNFFAIIKPHYEEIQKQLVIFANQVIWELKKIDDNLKADLQAKDCLFRIYRDARRLKEWDPVYKTNFGFAIGPNGKNDSRASYYLHIQANASFFGGGIYRPEPEWLLNLRHYLARHGDQYIRMTKDKIFVRQFWKVSWDCLTRPPKWFSKDSPHLDLLMKKQHLIMKKYSDKEVLAQDFINTFIDDCQLAMPFFHFLNTWYSYTWRKHEL